MQERIADYVAMHTAKGTKGVSGYELAARESATYFDERGIDMPNADDWKEFAVYIAAKIEREKGKRPSDDTVRVNYVTRGKAFYRWCNGQQYPPEQTASLFEEGKTEASPPPEPEAEMPRPTEAIRQPAPDEEDSPPAEKAAKNPERGEARTNETDKPAENVRVNFLLSKDNHEALLSLVYLKGQTLTAILTEAIEAYIQGYSEEIATLEETRRKFRSK